MAFADSPAKRAIFDIYFNKVGRFVDHPIKYDVKKHYFYSNKSPISLRRLSCHLSTMLEDVSGYIVLLGCIYSTSFASRVLLLDQFILVIYGISHSLQYLVYYTLYGKLDLIINMLNDVQIVDGIFRGSLVLKK